MKKKTPRKITGTGAAESNLHITYAPEGAFKEGEVVKGSMNGALAMCKIHSVENFIPRTRLITFHAPQIINGKKFPYVVVIEKCNMETKIPYGTIGEFFISGDKGYADKCLNKVREALDKDLKRQQSEYRTAASLTNQEKCAQQAQWSALSNLWPETVSAIQSGQDYSDSFCAEKYLITGKIDKANQATVDNTHRWKRRSRYIDVIKQELSTGWISKSYQDLRGKELRAAIKMATGHSIAIKTLRSICEALNLTPSQSVKQGPKPKVS